MVERAPVGQRGRSEEYGEAHRGDSPRIAAIVVVAIVYSVTTIQPLSKKTDPRGVFGAMAASSGDRTLAHTRHQAGLDGQDR
jgi:hypothetical protein